MSLHNFYSLKRFLVFGKQTYTSEAAAIGFKIFRSITHQENTWTTRNKDSTQIYTGWTCTCANFIYNNLALRQINIRLNTHTSHTKKEEQNDEDEENSKSRRWQCGWRKPGKERDIDNNWTRRWQHMRKWREPECPESLKIRQRYYTSSEDFQPMRF